MKLKKKKRNLLLEAERIGKMLKYWKCIFSNFLKAARQYICKTNVRHNPAIAKITT